jgi:hypothetical protein
MTSGWFGNPHDHFPAIPNCYSFLKMSEKSVSRVTKLNFKAILALTIRKLKKAAQVKNADLAKDLSRYANAMLL